MSDLSVGGLAHRCARHVRSDRRCVVVHYEALSWLRRVLKQNRLPSRSRMLFLIFVLLIVHVVEIWIFGAAYLGLIQNVWRQ